MIQTWVLTLVFYGGSAIVPIHYNFQTRDQCIKAQHWYQKNYNEFKLRTSCYPSFITK